MKMKGKQYDLTELKLEKERLINQLDLIEQKIKEEKERLIFNEHGIKVGTLVKNNKGMIFKVTNIHTEYEIGGKPWVDGCKQLKDGSFGKMAQQLFYYYELCD